MNLLVLSIYLSVSLSIQYLHCEISLQKNSYCPACHFQSSTQTTGQACTLDLPPLQLIETLQCFDIIEYKDYNSIIPASRSPPLP